MKTNNDYEALKSQYAEEAKQRWGNTDAYKEFEQRDTDFSKSAALLDAVFEEFAELNRSGISPDDEAAKYRSKNYSSVSPITSTPAQTKSSQDSVSYMSPTNVSGKISTGTARAQRRMLRRVFSRMFNNISGRVSKYACTFLFYIAN